jgi:RNA polymerase sigma-70 factor (ECF subfamily)
VKGGAPSWPRLVFSTARRDTARAVADDQAARFRSIMLPHMDAAFTLARYLTRDAIAAEDIVQDAYLRAFRGFADWRGEAPKAWLLAIVRNCFLNSVASAKARGPNSDIDAIADSVPDALIDRDDPETLTADRSEAAMLRATIEQLPEPFRETLVLRELEEMSYKDIAAIAQVPIGTIMSRLSRARQMLADLLLPSDARSERA